MYDKSDLTLTGKTLTFAISAFPEGITEALAVVYVPFNTGSERAFAILVKTAGVQTFKIPLPLGSGDDVFVFVQGGDGKKDLMPVSVAHIIME